jgi:hypothetical protein
MDDAMFAALVVVVVLLVVVVVVLVGSRASQPQSGMAASNQAWVWTVTSSSSTSSPVCSDAAKKYPDTYRAGMPALRQSATARWA